MENRKELAGVRVDNCSIRDALCKIESYLNNECLNIVETINMKTIVAAGEDEKVRQCLDEMDLVMPSNKEILEELGVTSGQRLHDAENDQFLHEFLKRVQRGKHSVYLLADTKNRLESLYNYLNDAYDGHLLICGSYAFEECPEDVEHVVNEINSVAPHVILAMLPTPMQEHFIWEHHHMFNAKIWFGIGAESNLLVNPRNPKRIYRRFLARHKMKRQIQSYETED